MQGDGTADAWEEQVNEPASEIPIYEVHERGRPLRLALQAVLAVVAIGLFLWLVFLLRNQVTSLAVVLVVALVVVLLVEVLLLDQVYHRLFPGPRGLPANTEEDSYIIGCPGCGTVFTVGPDELAEGSFGCQNCGRLGQVKDHDLNQGAIKEETCQACGNSYLEYMQHSECPVCHTYNEY